MRIVAHVTDNGLPERDERLLPLTEEGKLNLQRTVEMVPARITVNKTIGLHLTWFDYRRARAPTC